MVDEITAQTITIQKNLGLTHALKAHVLKNNYAMSDGSISAKEWDKTMDKLVEINEKRKKDGLTPIFSGGTDKTRAGWHTSFVVHPNQNIEFTKEEMADLYEAMGVSVGKSKTNPIKDTHQDKQKVKEEVDKKAVAKEEEKRQKAERKAAKTEAKEEKERLKAERKAAKVKAKEEKERLKAEKKQAKAEEKAAKKQAKLDKTHDEVATDVVVPADTKKRRTVQKTFDKADKLMISMAYDKENPYIKIDTETDDGVTYQTKTAKVKNRYIKARYDSNGNLKDVSINIDNSKKKYDPDVKFTQDAAYCDTNRKKSGYEIGITKGFDFDAIKQLISRIFNRDSK